MGNQGMNMCCNNAYVNKGPELITPGKTAGFRVKQQNREDKENINNANIGALYDGEMHITDRKDNAMLVNHIRTTSILNKSAVDFARVRELAQAANDAPKLHLKILSSGKVKGQVIKINS